jgi:hypothetical protein
LKKTSLTEGTDKSREESASDAFNLSMQGSLISCFLRTNQFV